MIYPFLLVILVLIPFNHGTYPSDGTYVYEEDSSGGFFRVKFLTAFPHEMPHMVHMTLDCWNELNIDGLLPLKEYDVPEGCSLDLRDYTYSQIWKRMSARIAEGARSGNRTFNKGELETLITKTDSKGNTYIEVTFNATKLHLHKTS